MKILNNTITKNSSDNHESGFSTTITMHLSRLKRMIKKNQSDLDQ